MRSGIIGLDGGQPSTLKIRRSTTISIIHTIIFIQLIAFSLEMTSGGNVERIYQCPSSCECTYETGWERMTIQCQLNGTQQPSDNNNSAPVTIRQGIQHLIIRNARLGPSPRSLSEDSNQASALKKTESGSGASADLNLNATVDFDLLTYSRESLTKIELYNVVIHGNIQSFSQDDEPPSFWESFLSFFYTKKIILKEFFSLQVLDNLTVCDSSQAVSTLIINSLPPVNHISIRNSSVMDLDPKDFSHLSLNLKTLSLVDNKIQKIPSGLLGKLENLMTLDLSGNEIEHLQEQALDGLENLRLLNLSRNSIQYIDTEVFVPLKSIEEVDLSFNKVIQVFEPYFESNPSLKTLVMRKTWAPGMFKDPLTSSRSRKEMERLINSLKAIKTLDLRDNQMSIIPESLTHTPDLYQVHLGGNQWACDCNDKWLPHWIDTTNVSITGSKSELQCHTKEATQHPLLEYLRSSSCPALNIKNEIPRKYYSHLDQEVVLGCHVQRSPSPSITWITPMKKVLKFQQSSSPQVKSVDAGNRSDISGHVTVLNNGSLQIHNFTKSDFGLYICIAQYENLNVTHYVHVGVDTSIFSDVRITSFVVGWLFSFAFLFLVILSYVIRCLLNRCGLECISVSNSYKAKRLRTFLDSLEQHKTSQLDWLRDNYNMQARRIKDNCIFQLERIRDSYTVQHKNMAEIREYGTNQLHTLRDQYYDQIRKVSGYSTQQLCKVRENYLFQRNRVCKFSSHQLLRLRETYKWQAQTLNKILENLPRSLNLDTCRGIGTCGRTNSIYLDDLTEFQPGDELSHFQMSLGGFSQMPHEKLEHVSLLLPPDFIRLPPMERILSVDVERVAEVHVDSCLPEPAELTPVVESSEEKPNDGDGTDLNYNI